MAAKKKASNGDYKSDSEKGEWVFLICLWFILREIASNIIPLIYF